MTADTLEKIINVLNVKESELFNFEHLQPHEELKKEVQSEIESLSYKELQYLQKTIQNLKQLKN